MSISLTSYSVFGEDISYEPCNKIFEFFVLSPGTLVKNIHFHYDGKHGKQERRKSFMAQKFTVILCDDEAAIISELQAAIDWENLNVQIVAAAGNGKEALDLIIQHMPDLVIMDICMPELDGLDAISRVRAAGINTDFIILSGYDEFQYAQRAIHYGARAFLLKPLNISELTDEIYRILSERAKISGNRMNQFYKQQMDLNCLRGILDGKFPDQTLLRTLLASSSLGISDTESFVMVLSYPEDNTPPDPDFVCELLKNASLASAYVFFSYKSYITGIFNQTDTLPLQAAERVLSVLQSHTPRKALPCIGAGDTVPALMQCQYSFSRALTALTYRLYNEHRQIFLPSDICTVPPVKKLSDFDVLPLVHFIIKRDHDSIRQFCHGFIKDLLYVEMPPPSYIYSTCYALLYHVEQEFSQYSHEEISEITDPQALYRCRTLHEISGFMIDAFTHLSEYIDAVYGYAESINEASMEIQCNDEIINTALSYIREHIADRIKIKDIADEIHLSASYFAIYFKNKTNVYLRDYLIQEKMEYARRSLVNPELSIYELAYNLGYRDYRSFSRAFKKIHGVTPSDFQNRYRHGKGPL